MSKYHKIQTVFKRNPDNNYKTLLMGQWSTPEFEYLSRNEWVFTEKIDGTNIRVSWDGTDVKFDGRTDKAQTPTFLLEELTRMFPPELLASSFPDADWVNRKAGPIVMYGEGYGARIQKVGRNYIPDGVSFILFDVRIGRFWLERHNVDELAESMGIRHVPTIGTGTLDDMIDMVRDGFYSQWGNFEAEGIIARPSLELAARSGLRIITKLKCRDFPEFVGVS